MEGSCGLEGPSSISSRRILEEMCMICGNGIINVEMECGNGIIYVEMESDSSE